jgi:ABC-type antimicrobial peptide transport system permease subunit
VLAVLRTPLRQVASGVLIGGVLGGILLWLVYERSLSMTQVAVFVGYVLLMCGVCLLACVVPTRRAMRIDPIDALRAD